MSSSSGSSSNSSSGRVVVVAIGVVVAVERAVVLVVVVVVAVIGVVVVVVAVVVGYNDDISGDKPCQCAVGVPTFRRSCPSPSSRVEVISVSFAQRTVTSHCRHFPCLHR
jgi:hypothetical protein